MTDQEFDTQNAIQECEGIIAQERVIIEGAQEAILLGTTLERLRASTNFRRLIVKEFGEVFLQSQVTALARTAHNPGANGAALLSIQAVSIFNDFLERTEQRHLSAATQIERSEALIKANEEEIHMLEASLVNSK